MVKKLNSLATRACLGISGFFRGLKEDEQGLSGVVVAVLLILIAVLAVAAIWTALSGQLQTWWGDISGKQFNDTSLT